MIQDDWILRIIEQLGVAIAARLSGKPSETLDEALADAKTRTALTPEQMGRLPLPVLFSMLGGEELDAGAAMTMALVLVGEGTYLDRARQLMDAALAAEPDLATEINRKIRASLG